MGSLNILNVAGGDVKISFDTNDSAEAKKAKGIIEDMLKRGYALLVKTEDGSHTRARKFDSEKGEYIITEYVLDDGKDAKKTKTKAPAETKQKRATRERRVPMRSASTYAVAPSAGG